MNVRSATLDDLAAIEELWRAFEAEVPPPAHEDVDQATELAEIRAIVESGLGWVAERNGAAIGLALARRRGARVGRITDLYVVPTERRAGVADSLLRAVAARLAEDGVDTIDLEVMASNAEARAVVRALGLPRRGARSRIARRGARRASRGRSGDDRRSARSTFRRTTST